MVSGPLVSVRLEAEFCARSKNGKSSNPVQADTLSGILNTELPENKARDAKGKDTIRF